jgi:hypothetical protein
MAPDPRSPRRRWRRAWVCALFASIVPVSGGLHADPKRFTAATPDEMLALALTRANEGGDSGLAGLAIAHALADRASAGRARSGVASVGNGSGPVAAEARRMAAALNPSPGTVAPTQVTKWSVLGPFQDTGAGLARREGPEAPGQIWGTPNASYAWGAYDVRWREVPDLAASARGIPLDLFIHPRKESCSYLASRVTVRHKGPIVVSVGSTGAVRLIWDGFDAASSDELHRGLVFDRIAARIDASAGDHLLAVKVCSGALEDLGRVRVNASDPDGQPVDIGSAPLTSFHAPAGPKPTIVAVPTAFSRAVAVAGNPNAGRALIAAIVRALGDADDLRSPRAPGLVDKVATMRGVSADELAMAGWISPFGAARSGWLNLAVERALSSGDMAAASFAERRIAASRLGTGWSDWAAAIVAREPLASEKDPEAILIKSMVRAERGQDGLQRAALADLLETANREGERASVALWSEIASLSSGVDPETHLWAKTQIDRRTPEARDAGLVRAWTIKDANSVKAAARAAIDSGSITSCADFVGVASTLERAGLRQDAHALYEKAVIFCPNRAEAWHDLTETAYERGDTRTADRALARARELDPAEVRYKAEIAVRGSPPARPAREKAGTAVADSAYLVAPEVFLARKNKQPADKTVVFDRELHWMRAVTFHADRRVSQLIQYAREIVIEPRTQEELFEAVPAEGDETEVLIARVHRASGGVALAEEQISEGPHATIRWPDLKTGDVVEVAIRSWTSGPVGRRGDPPFFFVDYAGALVTHPLLYNDVIVDSPADQPLAVDVLHGSPDRMTDDTRNGRRTVRMIWDRPVNIPDEPLAPKSSEVLPTIVGSTFRTWKDFAEWYQAAVNGFTEPDDQVRRLAADLTRGKASKADRVRALFEFVADDIRYVNYVSGEWWLPNRPQQLLARRQGDCDDKAILLITLLKAVGIEATEVLVQTRYLGQPSLLLSPNVAVPLFDHGIAFLPGANGSPGTWLDATSPQSRLGPLPSMDARALAMFASQKPPAIVPTPAGSPAEHGVDGTWEIKLGLAGAGDLDAVERHTGDHAFALRTNLVEKDARAQWVEQNLLHGWFSAIEVDKNVGFEPSLEAGAARVHYRAHSDGLARREGDELVVPLAPQSTITSQLAPLVTRTLPVVLPPNTAPSHQQRRIRIVPPARYRAADLPKGGTENGGEFGFARLEVRKDGAHPGRILVERTVVFDLATIPVDKYAAWRAWLQRVDALLHRSIRFAPEKGARR